MMAKNSVYSYSSTAASNTDIGGIDTDEGMAPSDVNNAIREMMAQLRELTDNLGGLNVSAGTDTVTLTSGMSITAYAQGQLFGFEAGGTNTTAVTLNVDSVGAKAVVKNHDVALAAGDIEAGQIVLVAYEATADNFQMISPLGNQALFSLVDDTTPQLGGALDANGNNIQFSDNTGIVDDNGNEAMLFQTVASAVNYFDISPSATGGDLIAAASGDDTDIDIDLQPKGAGLLLYGGTEISRPATQSEVDTGTEAVKAVTPSTLANRPAFLVYPSADASNVTGNGVDYDVAFNTEVFDRGGDFASNTFTAPVTGQYLLTANITFGDVTATNTDGVIRILTSNGTYQQFFNPGNMEASAVYGRVTATLCVVADMDAADTATVRVTIQQGTQTIDVSGTRQNTNFSGCMV